MGKKRDQIRMTREAGLLDRADHAGGRPGEQRRDGVAAHRFGRQAPTVRLHDAETALELLLAESLLDA